MIAGTVMRFIFALLVFFDVYAIVLFTLFLAGVIK